MVARGKAAQQPQRGGSTTRQLRGGGSNAVAPTAPSGDEMAHQGESSCTADRSVEELEETPEIAGNDESDEVTFEYETQVEGMETFKMEGEGENFEGEGEEFAEWVEGEDADVEETYGSSQTYKEYVGSEGEFYPGDAVDGNADGEGNDDGMYVEGAGENMDGAEEEMLDYDEDLDETGECDREQVHEDFDPEDAGEKEDGDNADAPDNTNENNGDTNLDGNVDISWVEELWNQKQIEDSWDSESKIKSAEQSISGQCENKSVQPEAKPDQQAAGTSMSSKPKTKGEETGETELSEDKEAGRKGDDGHDKERGDKSLVETEEKADEASSSDEEGETEEEKVVKRRKRKQIELASIPHCFFGPAFDKSYFKYSICVRPVVQNDFSQPGIQAIASIAGSVSFIQEQPNYKVMKLLTTHKLDRLMEKILFSTFCSNNLTIDVERREPTKFMKGSDRSTDVNYPSNYTKVVNKVTFRQKNAYTRRFLMDKRTVKYPGRSVKQRSLFLQNLPSSMDENFLRILFPRSLKVGLVKVSSDIRSAVLQMADHRMAYHHLICFTDFFIDGRDIQMGIVDMSQEEALREYNTQKTKETSLHRQKSPASTAVTATEAQRKQVEKAFDSLVSKSSPGKKVSHEGETSSRRKDDRSSSRRKDNQSSSSKKDDTSSTRNSEKTLDSKKNAAAKERSEKSSKSKDQEKQDKEKKDGQKSEREKSDKEKLEREKRDKERREQNSKERERQRVSRERQRQRDIEKEREIRRRREERTRRQEEAERRRREEREIELQRELQMQREIKMRREMEMQLELEKQRELERLKMEQLQELERQKLERQQKEQLQLIMIEQERQLQAREEAARKLKEMEFEEGRRRQREKEEKKREEELKRERKQERRRQQERQRESELEQMRKRRDQDRGRHEKDSMWDPPAAKKSRFNLPSTRQQQDSYEDSFSHDGRDERRDHRTPGRSGTDVGFGQGLLGSLPHTAPRAQTSGNQTLRQTLEQEVAKQAEELQRNLALLAEFQNDPSRAVRSLVKVSPSLAPISSAGRDMMSSGRNNRAQETVVLKQDAIREVEMDDSVTNEESYGDDLSGSYMLKEYGKNFGQQSRPLQHSSFQQQPREHQNQASLGRGGRHEQTSAGRGRRVEQSFEREGHVKQASLRQGGHLKELREGPYHHSSFDRSDPTDQSFSNEYLEEPYHGQDEEMMQSYYGEDMHADKSSYGRDSHVGQSSFGRSGQMNQSSFKRGGQMAPSSHGRGGQMAQSSYGRSNRMEQSFGRDGRGRESMNERGDYLQPASGRGPGLLGAKPESFDEGSFQQQHLQYEGFGNERQMQAEPAKAFSPPGQRGRGTGRMGNNYGGRGHGGQGREASHQQVMDFGHGKSSYGGSQNYY